MHRLRSMVLIAGSSVSSFACAFGPQTLPQFAAPHELVLVDRGRLEIVEGEETIARAPRYKGLESYVQCVPLAANYAKQANRAGRARVGLAWSGATLGAASFAGFSAFAYEGNPQAVWTIVGTAAVSALFGATLSGLSRQQAHQAHGNAIDAMNAYNDALGFYGGHCQGAKAIVPPAQVPGGVGSQSTASHSESSALPASKGAQSERERTDSN